MFSNDLAVIRDDGPRSGLDVGFEKVAEATLTNKADSGGIFFTSGDKPLSVGNIAHFRFEQITDREQRGFDLLFGESPEKIALIFISIETSVQWVFAVDTTDVVPGGDEICTELSSIIKKRAKLDFSVTEDVRVWGSSCLAQSVLTCFG